MFHRKHQIYSYLFLLREIGYYGIFTLSGVLMLIGMFFCIYGVEEGPRPLPTQPIQTITDGKELQQQQQLHQKKEVPFEEPKKVNLVLDFFNFKDFGVICRVFTKKRADKKRRMLYLCYLLLFFGFGPMFGERISSFLGSLDCN